MPPSALVLLLTRIRDASERVQDQQVARFSSRTTFSRKAAASLLALRSLKPIECADVESISRAKSNEKDFSK